MKKTRAPRRPRIKAQPSSSVKRVKKSQIIVPPIPDHLLDSLRSAVSDVHTHLQSTTNDSTPDNIDMNTLEAIVKLQESFIVLSETFPMFSKFPLEIRAMIWRMAGGVGRIIGARAIVHLGDIVLKGTAARCPLLLTCKESRKEAMKDKGHFGADWKGGAKIYANFSVDTIWIEGVDCFSSSTFQWGLRNILGRRGGNSTFEKGLRNLMGSRGEGAAVQNLAIDARLMNEIRDAYLAGGSTLKGGFLFDANLKNLFLVIGETRGSLDTPDVHLVDPEQAFPVYSYDLSNKERREMWPHAGFTSNAVLSPTTTNTWSDLEQRDQQALQNENVLRQKDEDDSRAKGYMKFRKGDVDRSKWEAPRVSYKRAVSSKMQDVGGGTKKR